MVRSEQFRFQVESGYNVAVHNPVVTVYTGEYDKKIYVRNGESVDSRGYGDEVREGFDFGAALQYFPFDGSEFPVYLSFNMGGVLYRPSHYIDQTVQARKGAFGFGWSFGENKWHFAPEVRLGVVSSKLPYLNTENEVVSEELVAPFYDLRLPLMRHISERIALGAAPFTGQTWMSGLSFGADLFLNFRG